MVYMEVWQDLHSKGLAHGAVLLEVDLQEDYIGVLVHEPAELQSRTAHEVSSTTQEVRMPCMFVRLRKVKPKLCHLSMQAGIPGQPCMLCKGVYSLLCFAALPTEGEVCCTGQFMVRQLATQYS